MVSAAFYRTFLKSELARRCESNPLYSLRAFSRSLEIDAGTLSGLISGKRPLSIKMAHRILGKLELGPLQKQKFLKSIIDEQKGKNLSRIGLFKNANVAYSEPDHIEVEKFKVISDWYHYAILELTFVDGFQSNQNWIARALGISVTEAKLAIDRLLELGILRDENGVFIKVPHHMTTKEKHITTPALKNQQKQFLEKARFSLDNDPVETRNHTGMTMAIDPSKIPAAKQMIEDFTQSLCEFLESGERKQVYQLAINLFSLQTMETKND